jgi:hypothetical protein
MRTLLRKMKTGLYFQGPDRWTSNPGEALDFQLIDRALNFIRQWGLEDVEVAFAFRDRKQVTRVPADKIAARYSEE